MESAQAHGFRSGFSGEGSQTSLASIGQILWGTDKHFHQIVMERVIKLALKLPLKLGMIEIARVHLEYVGMDRNRALGELDEHLDSIALLSRVKAQQRMLVKP